MIASSNEKKPCWFCNLGADQMCLKPEQKEYMLLKGYSCSGSPLPQFHIIGSLVRWIATLLNIKPSSEACWFCAMGMEEMCMTPERGRYEWTSALFTCNGHRLRRFHIGGGLVRRIAALRNRGSYTKG
jgi:hypothetical protein